MFLNINLTQAQIISEVLTNRPLTYVPGETYYYSNFGYCLLGRVIEKITQKMILHRRKKQQDTKDREKR